MNTSAGTYEVSLTKARAKMLTEQITELNQLSRSATAQTKLHIMHALLRGRIFDGNFEARGKSITFSFIPAKAAIVENKLVLNGRMNFAGPNQSATSFDGVT